MTTLLNWMYHKLISVKIQQNQEDISMFKVSHGSESTSFPLDFIDRSAMS